MNAKVKNEQAGDIRHNMRENSRTVNATDQPYSENINTINREYPLCVTKFEEFLEFLGDLIVAVTRMSSFKMAYHWGHSSLNPVEQKRRWM